MTSFDGFSLSGGTSLNYPPILSCCISAEGFGILCTQGTDVGDGMIANNVYVTTTGGQTWAVTQDDNIWYGTKLSKLTIQGNNVGAVSSSDSSVPNQLFVTNNTSFQDSWYGFTMNVYKCLWVTKTVSFKMLSSTLDNTLVLHDDNVGGTTTTIGFPGDWERYRVSTLYDVNNNQLTALSCQAFAKNVVVYSLNLLASSIETTTTTVATANFEVVGTAVSADYFLVVCYSTVDSQMKIYKAPLEVDAAWVQVGSTFTDVVWTDLHAINLYINPNNTNHFCVTCAKNSIYYSHDGGANVMESAVTQTCEISLPEQENANPLIGLNDLLIYMSGNGATQSPLISFDCGKEWRNLDLGGIETSCQAIDSVNHQCLLGTVSSNQMLYRSLQSDEQTITFDPFDNGPYVYITDFNISLSGTASSGLPVTYEVFTDEFLTTLSTDVLVEETAGVYSLSVQAFGTYYIRAYQWGDIDTYPADPVVRSLLVEEDQPPPPDPIDQTVTLTVDVDEATLEAGGVTLPVMATTDSGLTVVVQVFTSVTCDTIDTSVTVDPSIEFANQFELAFSTLGTFYVRASQDGNDDYYPAVSEVRTITITKQTQTITFSTFPDVEYSTDLSILLTATASSGLTVSYTVFDDEAGFVPATFASIEGETLVIAKPGTYYVKADQEGDAYVDPATSEIRGITITKQTQTIDFDNLTNATYTDSFSLLLTATASSGLTISYTVFDDETCLVASVNASIFGNTLSVGLPGTYYIKASQAGDEYVDPATPEVRTITITKQTQIIIFGAFSDVAYSELFSLLLTAVASSGLTITYTVFDDLTCLTPSTNASIEGTSLLIQVPGTYYVKATQSGNAYYDPANEPVQSITMTKANQTLTFDFSDEDVSFVSPNFVIPVEATSTSGLEVVFQLFDSTDTVIAEETSPFSFAVSDTGSYYIIASQAGNTIYNAADPVQQMFTLSRQSHTLTFDELETVVWTPGLTVELVASSSAGITDIQFALVTAEDQAEEYAFATIEPSTVRTGGEGITYYALSITGPGQLYIKAFSEEQPLTNYEYSQSSIRSLTIMADQTITFNPVDPIVFVNNYVLPMSATSNRGLSVTYQVFATGETETETTSVLVQTRDEEPGQYKLVFQAPGVYDVYANQAGNEFYLAATSVMQTVTIKYDQLLTLEISEETGFTFDAENVPSALPFTVGYTGSSSSGLGLTYRIFSDETRQTEMGPLLVNQETPLIFQFQSPGIYYLRAYQDGDAIHFPAQEDAVLTVQKYSPSVSLNEFQSSLLFEPGLTLMFSAVSSVSLMSLQFILVNGVGEATEYDFATMYTNSVEFTAPGTVYVKAYTESTSLYNAAESSIRSLTIQETQTITFASIDPIVFTEPQYTLRLSATSSSGLLVTYRVYVSGETETETSSASVNLVMSEPDYFQILFSDPGVYDVYAEQAGNAEVGPAPEVMRTVTIKSSQVITFDALEAPDREFDLASTTWTWPLVASSSSNLDLSFHIFDDEQQTQESSAVSVQAGSEGGSIELLIQVPGTYYVSASQEGNQFFYPANIETRSFTVTQEAQTITFVLANEEVVFEDAMEIALTASASSGLTVTYYVTDDVSGLIVSTTASIVVVEDTSLFRCTLPGTYYLHARQLGNVIFSPAEEETCTLVITKKSQSSSFLYNDADHVTTFQFGLTVSLVDWAISTSELPITYTVFDTEDGTTTSQQCLVQNGGGGGLELYVLVPGTYYVRANQSGDAYYLPAPEIQQSVVIRKMAQSVDMSEFLSNQVYSPGLQLSLSTVTSSSGLTVLFSVYDTAGGAGTPTAYVTVQEITNTLLIQRPGTFYLRASQAGNEYYAAATTQEKSFTIGKQTQEITWEPFFDVHFANDLEIPLTAVSSSSLSVTYEVFDTEEGTGSFSLWATISETEPGEYTFSTSRVGTFYVRASQAGNDYFSAASSVMLSVQILKQDQTLEVSDLEEVQYVPGLTVSVQGTAPITLFPVTFRVFDTEDAVTNSAFVTVIESLEEENTFTLEIGKPGTYYVVATQIGDDNFNPVEETQILHVLKMAQTIQFEELLASYSYAYHGVIEVTATASSELPVSFVSSNPEVAFVQDGQVLMRLPGQALLYAVQTGDDYYSAASNVARMATIVSEAICFAPLVRIAVKNEADPYQLSHIPISELQEGQLVFTKDKKFVPIAKIGKMKVCPGKLSHQRMFQHKKKKRFQVTGNHGILYQEGVDSEEYLAIQEKKFGIKKRCLHGIPVLMAAVSSQMKEMAFENMIVYHLVLESSDENAQFAICGEEEIWSESCSMAVYKKYLQGASSPLSG